MTFNPRTLLLAVAALATAGLTAFLVQGWIANQRAQLLAQRPVEAPREQPNQILVAKQDLPAGLFVKPEHLHWRAWPADGLDASFVRKGEGAMDPFTGAVVRKGIVAGEPVTAKRVVKPGERGFLAAVLSPGMRAVSVKVNAASGISGLVFPGDHVDLILSHKIKAQGTKNRSVRSASETVLTDVRVLAIGQTTDDQKGKPIVAKTATLEVWPKQAEVVAVVIELGKLSLSLRSLAKPEDEIKPNGKLQAHKNGRAHSYTRDSDVSRLIGAASSNLHTVEVIQGSKATTQKLRRAVR